MKILVIGCGKFGSSIAVELEKAGHEVSIVDKVYESFEKLPDDFHGKLNSGDALVYDVLIRSRVEQVEAVVLTIGSDVLNLVLARMLNEKFGIKNIIALNSDPDFRFLYDEMEVPTVSMMSWGVLRVGSMLSARKSKGVVSVGTSEVGVYNIEIPTQATNYSASDLLGVEQCMIFAVTHNGLTTTLTKDSAIEAGDVLHVSTSTEGLRGLYTCMGMAAKEVSK